jgi:DNA mismatch repair protein MSH6
LLKFYHESFDAEKARKDGKIIPSPGVNKEYDQAIDDIKSIEKQFQDYLKEQSKLIGASLSYFGSAKNRYQLEIPESKCKKLPDDYENTSSKKGLLNHFS